VSSWNTAVGGKALKSLTIGQENVAIGVSTMELTTEGKNNTALGFGAMYENTTGDTNTAIGDDALLKNQTGDGNVAIGYCAGFWETGSNAFYVDNQYNINTATDKTHSLLYGTFNPNSALQTLAVNGTLSSPYTSSINTSGNAATSTTAPTTALLATGTVTGATFQAQTFTNGIVLNNSSITTIKTATYHGVIDCGANPTAIDWTTGLVQKANFTSTGAITITMTAPAGPTSVKIRFTNLGVRTPTFSPVPKWASGTPPTWTASGMDLLCMDWDGTSYVCTTVLDAK
jgi:hypothetical protein